MKSTTLTFALVSLSILAITSSAFAEGNFVVNKAKSQITFISEAPAEKIVGTAKNVSGTIKLGTDYKTASGSISLPVASMNTGNGLRDRHIKSKQWLNAKKNPNITFTIDSLEKATSTTAGAKTTVKGIAVGKITVNGVAKAAKANIVLTILKKESKTIAKVAVTFKVKLKDHKIAGKRGVVGNKVGKVIDIKGTLYGAIQ